MNKKFKILSLTDRKKDPADWITKLEKIRTQLDKMGHVISDKDFVIHILANLPEGYKRMVESLETDLDNEDDPLTLDRMLVELDVKYEKICKKNNYDPENKDEKRGKKETTTMVWHSQQIDMAYLKADATYAKIGGTKAISSIQKQWKHSERTNYAKYVYYK